MKKITLLILTLLMSLSGFSQALDETFDSVADGSLPAGWTRFDNAQGVPAARRPWTVQSVNSSSAPKAALSERYQIGIGNTLLDWLVTPAVTVPPNGQLQFNTRQGLPGDQGGLYQILVSLTPPNSANTSSFSQVVEFTETQISNATTAWELKTVPLPAYVGQTVYIAFVKKSFQASANPNTTVDSGWYIDDVRVQSKCLTPTDLRSVENRLTSSDLTWVRQSGETAWDVVVAREEQTLAEAITQTAFPDLGGIKRYTGTLPYKTNENGITLTPGSFYKFYVRAVCSETNVSDWTEPYYFVSLGFGETCAAPIVIPRIGFSVNSDTAASRDRVDTMQGPNCIAGANTVNYMAGNDVFYSFVAPTTGEVRIKMTPNAPNSSLFVYDSCPTPGQACLAGVANNGSATRIIPALPVTAGNTYIVVLSSSAATQTYGYYLEIQYVSCDEPTNLNATTPTQTSAVLSWTNPIGVSTWEIAVQPAGAGLPEGAGYSVTTGGTAVTSFTTLPISNLTDGTTLTGAPLQSSTAYQYWVRGECTLNGTTYSPWAGPFQFFTPICDPTDQCDYNFILRKDTGNNGWNGALMHVKQNGIVVKILGPTFTTGNDHSVVVPLCKNMPFEVLWVNGGLTPATVGIRILNRFGQQLYTKSFGTGAPSTTTPLFTESNVNCDFPRCVQPLNQNVTAGSITANSAILTWAMPTNISAATYEVYVIPTSELVTPVNGSPVGNTAPGYFTATTPYTASNLRSDTQYSYYVRTVCDGVRSSDWVGPLTFTTLVSCAAPTNLSSNGEGLTNAILTWSQIPATISSWEVLVQNQNAGAPAYTAVGVVTTTPTINYGVDLGTTLAASSRYEYYVRALCAGTDKSRWVGPFLFKTQCPPVDLPYSEGFNTTSTYEVCWNTRAVTGSNVWDMNSGSPFEGDQSASVLPNATNNNTLLISPTINLLPNYRLKFRYKVDAAGANNTVKVLISTTGTATANFTELLSRTFTNTNYEERIVNLDGIAPGQINIAFQVIGNASATRIYIDNVIFEPITGCPVPQDLSVQDVKAETATLSWTHGHNETQWQVVVQVAGTGVPPLNYAGNPITNNTAYPANTNGDLLASTEYEYYVRSYCSATEQSTWVGPIKFKTLRCNPENSCNWTFVMTDVRSDTWNSTMTVVQNNTVLETLTGPLTGQATRTVSVNLCSGIPFEVRWGTSSLLDAADVGLTVRNAAGEIIYSKPAGVGRPNTTVVSGVVSCAAIICPAPTNLSVYQNSETSARLSWTGGGAETQWEYIVRPATGEYPAVSGTSIGTRSVNVTVTPRTVYEFYVRAICGAGNTSYWSGPFQFILYQSPGCVTVDIANYPSGTVLEQCPAPTCTPVNLSATFTPTKATTSYVVQSIPYDPPFPFTGGTPISVGTDDVWSPRIDLPFNFCFFGNFYNRVWIGSNGVISFDPKTAGGFHGYTLNPPAFPNSNIHTNAIMLFQDIDPRYNAANVTINTQVLGTYPCRAVVVNFANVPYYHSTNHENGALNTFQMILYEKSNIIDFHVLSKPDPHAFVSGPINGGRAVLGIQNAAGNLGYTPPGRNVGVWSAANEGWRFSPDGATPVVNFEWKKNGDFYSNSQNVTVCESETSLMEAVASYLNCDGVRYEIQSDVTIKINKLIYNDPQDMKACAGSAITFNLTDNDTDILSITPDPANYSVTYYLSQLEADSGTTGSMTSYTTSANTTIYVRIENTVTGCWEVKTFDLLPNEPLPDYTLNTQDGIATICSGVSTTLEVTPINFALTDATYEWILPDGNISTETTHQLPIAAGLPDGIYNYSVKVNDGCETIKTFVLTVSNDAPVVDFHYANASVCIAAGNPVAIPDGSPLSTLGNFTASSGLVFANVVTGEIDLTLTPAGVYTVTFEVPLTPCNPRVSKDVQITVTDLTTPNVALGYNEVTVCSNGTIATLLPNAGITAGGVFEVDTPGLVIDNAGIITIAGSTPGVYNVTYSFKTVDVINCLGTASSTPVVITINAGQNADATFGYSKTSYCLNAPSVTPSFVTTPGVGQFSATGGLVVNSTTGEINFNGIAPGSYTVTYTIQDDTATCLKGAHIDFALTIEAELDVNIANDCVNASYVLTATPDNLTYTYTWKNAAGTTVGTNSPTFNVTEYAETISNPVYPMVFTVTVNNGCDTTETFSVPNIACNIPKGISPNGDGSNDEFDLTGFNVRKLEIFNRYGTKVNSFSNYRKEWHGQSDSGNELPDGTYYYVIERDGVKTVTGWVQINRQR